MKTKTTMTETTPNNQEEVVEEVQTEAQLPNDIAEENTALYEEAIEAILFAAGHPVTYDKLALALECSPSQVKKIVKDYAKRYNSTKLPRGVMFIVFDDSCQLCTKEDYISYIRIALGIRKSGTLSASSIETLAIVAYHQPVTRAYVDAVRGVDSSYAITNLIERELICVRGRLDAPGRPMLYGTTEGFLRCFGLSSLSELPGIDNEEISEVFSTIDEKLGEHEEDSQISIDEMLSEENQENSGEETPEAQELSETPAEAPLSTEENEGDIIDLISGDDEDTDEE